MITRYLKKKKTIFPPRQYETKAFFLQWFFDDFQWNFEMMHRNIIFLSGTKNLTTLCVSNIAKRRRSKMKEEGYLNI